MENALKELKSEIPIYRLRGRSFVRRYRVAFSFVHVNFPTQSSMSWFSNFHFLMEIYMCTLLFSAFDVCAFQHLQPMDVGLSNTNNKDIVSNKKINLNLTTFKSVYVLGHKMCHSWRK
jgi:hypothetical protein